jgi:tRNA(Ile)-lysidine synthase
MSLIGRVRRTLQRHRLTKPGTRVVAALSGGPDSMALVHLLRALDDAGDLEFVAIAHLNHQLRDLATDDEQFCAGVAASLERPFVVDRIDVRAVAAARRRSIEDAAHVVRYEFFERAVSAHYADVIALGHTQDDQAETFLLRLVRGAGSRGLAAMHPRNGIVVRPLLECSRAEVRRFLDVNHVASVHDATNDDVGVPRNRVRAELLPLIRDRFNPRIVNVLAAEADLARADEEFLAALATDWIARHVKLESFGVWTVETAELSALSRAIAWRVLHETMRRAASGRLIGYAHIARAWAVATEGAPAFDAPGQRVERVGTNVVLTGRPAGSAARRRTLNSSVPRFSYPLSVPGEVAIPEIDSAISAEVLIPAEGSAHPDGVAAVVPKEKVAAGLVVRNRRAGDRLKLAAGHRKLQDLLVDRKVPRAERDRIPIVVDTANRIVWVAGQATDRDFQVSDPAQAVVILRLKGVGGSC